MYLFKGDDRQIKHEGKGCVILLCCYLMPSPHKHHLHMADILVSRVGITFLNLWKPWQLNSVQYLKFSPQSHSERISGCPTQLTNIATRSTVWCTPSCSCLREPDPRCSFPRCLLPCSHWALRQRTSSGALRVWARGVTWESPSRPYDC